MSVRDGLLALLTIGPAYGLQLHGEFLDRAAHRAHVNVGQVYATLDRLRERGLVTSAGSTDDGLPLYRLTSSGRTAASAWLAGDDASPEELWDDVLDRLLIATSIAGATPEAIFAAYRSSTASRGEQTEHPQRALAERAHTLRSEALHQLVDVVAAQLKDAGPTGLARGFAGIRPRRGRRSTTSEAVHTDEVA
ncbi:PadR family transcriptional regulator [Microbacteriaceae bacterium VKM Ac-2855]|nr:PadR family transcriptional regulator [Microbacteriaceae bacterium VKM Ac-2855]